jgi:VanZ family protein
MLRAGARGDGPAVQRVSAHPQRHRYAFWAALYAVAVVYSSVVIGPLGLHFVPTDPAEQWQRFLATPLVDSGSDQRADWIANLLLAVPLGFLLTGTLASARGAASRVLGTIVAGLLGFTFVLAVKYAQLYFPPRTVSLNYIIAQSLGICIGAAIFHVLRSRAPRLVSRDDQATARLVLDLAVMVVVCFVLFPFDVVLSLDDMQARLATLPHDLLALPGEDRPMGVRLMLLAGTIVSTIPVGMRLALRRDRPGLARIMLIGTGWMLALLLASSLVLSTTPSFASTVARIVGVITGAVALHWAASQNLLRARFVMARLVPIIVIPYLLAVAYVQGLFSSQWQTSDQVLAGLYWRGLTPLYSYYIVSKAHAALSMMGHAALYAPIGVMMWLRYGGSRRSVLAAAILAALAAIAVEAARAFQPERQPDINAVGVAAFAAGLAVWLSPMAWRVFGSISRIGPEQEVAPTRRQLPGAGVSDLGRAQREAFERQSSNDAVSTPVGAQRQISERPLSSVAVSDVARWQREAFEQITGAQRTVALATPIGMPLWLRLIAAAACAIGAGLLVAAYPLGTKYAAAAVAVWVAVLLWRPSLWLVLLPAIVPSVDLALWSGWLVTSEADIAVLATLAVLLLRDPPAWSDLAPRGAARVALLLALLACLVGVVRAYTAPFSVPGGSDNPYLEPLNALRLAKPFIAALALLPFLLARHRVHGDVVQRFGWGMLAGLAIVGLAAIGERAAFVGVLDEHSDYRIVATFSSMHIGGGHIGAYVALALPFLVVGLHRPRMAGLLAMVVVIALGGYTLVVTFARTAYVAALGGMGAAALGWAAAQMRHGRRLAAIASALLPVAVCGIVAVGLFTPYMAERIDQSALDLVAREDNWSYGLSIDQRNLLSILFGMGTGTYPRIAASRASPDAAAGNYVLGHNYLTLRSGPEFYFGQKVIVAPRAGYELSLDVRAPEKAVSLTTGLCAKLLLYSENCSGQNFAIEASESWQRITARITSPETWEGIVPPVEFWLGTSGNQPLDVGGIHLVGPDGQDAVANGDFHDGTDRWFFTSDRHLAWRTKDFYVATWFDSGALGLICVFVLIATSMGTAGRAVSAGNPWAAPVVGGLSAMLLSGVFDNVFEAPRLALLYDLVLMLGLIVGVPRDMPAQRAVQGSRRAQPTMAV